MKNHEKNGPNGMNNLAVKLRSILYSQFGQPIHQLIRKNCARRFLNQEDERINVVYNEVEEYLKNFLDVLNDPDCLNHSNDSYCAESLIEASRGW